MSSVGEEDASSLSEEDTAALFAMLGSGSSGSCAALRRRRDDLAPSLPDASMGKAANRGWPGLGRLGPALAVHQATAARPVVRRPAAKTLACVVRIGMAGRQGSRAALSAPYCSMCGNSCSSFCRNI